MGDTAGIASRIVQPADRGRVLLGCFAWLQLGSGTKGVSRGIAELKAKGAADLVDRRELRSA